MRTTILLLSLIIPLCSFTGGYKTVKTYQCPEANQGVAADGEHFYAIGNQTIAKYTLKGKKVAEYVSEVAQK